MLNTILWGADGKLGRFVLAELENDKYFNVIGKISLNGKSDLEKIKKGKDKPGLIIDASNAGALDDVLSAAFFFKCGVVIATTGYSEAQREKIKNASKAVPIFISSNMSLGVNLMHNLIKTSATALGDAFDIEIIEKHHNQKADAPSGTALALVNTLKEVFPDKKVIYGRGSETGKRGSEIAVHAIRGGTVVGEHEVLFIGKDEVLSITHIAQSRVVFAQGAIKAAKWLTDKPAALYNMKDLIENR